MNRNYIFLTLLMVVLAAGTIFLKEEPEYQQINAEDLLYDVIQPTRYVTTDQIAKMIINKDPTLELIDVRDSKSFEKFSLNNAINVPLDSLILPDYQEYFGIPGTKVVFYSNDDILADQSWVIARRLGFKDMYVMKGGLNKWVETIIKPQEPPETAPETAFEQYQFRKGAQIFFTGSKIEAPGSSTKKEKVTVRRKKKTTAASGGC